MIWPASKLIGGDAVTPPPSAGEGWGGRGACEVVASGARALGCAGLGVCAAEPPPPAPAAPPPPLAGEATAGAGEALAGAAPASSISATTAPSDSVSPTLTLSSFTTPPNGAGPSSVAL